MTGFTRPLGCDPVWAPPYPIAALHHLEKIPTFCESQKIQTLKHLTTRPTENWISFVCVKNVLSRFFWGGGGWLNSLESFRNTFLGLGLSPVPRVSCQGTQAVGHCFGGCHEKTFGNLTGLATDCTKGHAREDVNVVNLVMALMQRDAKGCKMEPTG